MAKQAVSAIQQGNGTIRRVQAADVTLTNLRGREVVIDGNGYELNAIAAVVIGGTSLAGGIGTVAGSMIGALTLSILDNILGLRNVQSEYQAILKGVIIVLAVIVQRQRR